MVTLTSGAEVGAQQTFANVGTAVRVLVHDDATGGIFQLDVVGEDRFEIVRSSLGRTGLNHAAVRWIRPEPKVKLPEEYAELGQLLGRVIEQNGAGRFAEPIELDDASWVSSRLVEMLQLPASIAKPAGNQRRGAAPGRRSGSCWHAAARRRRPPLH